MNMETIAYSPQMGKTLSYLLAAIFLTVATGAVLSARASNRATWTGEASNGLFQDSGNWTCFNESDEQVAGVPAADAAITLAADVPANGWADANFAAMSGPIDLAGHSLTVLKTFFDGATPALTDLIVNGDFETDIVPEGQTSLNQDPTGWTRSQDNVVITRNDTTKTYNNNKTDNGCYVAGYRNITQTFTLPEDAVLSLSFNRINRNTGAGSYYTSNGNVQIDGSPVLSWSGDGGYGEKSYSATVALAAGTHTIKFTITTSSGSTFDNISLTYQPSSRTVTDSVGDGELRVNVPEGETATNVDVNMTGHLKLVKEGAGAFVSQRNALTYDSGTIVAAGTFSTTEGAETDETVNRAFGALGSSITVCTGATLLNGGDGCDFRNYNVVLDGGTLAAGAAGTLVETNGACSVSVGANGGTLDNGGFAVTVAADIAGTGALSFIGAGTTRLSAGVSMLCPAIVESGVTLSVPGTDTATFGSLTLAGGSTLDLAAYVGGVTPLAASTFTLPASGTVGLTLAGGAFEAGLYAICANDSLGSGDGSKFAPSAGELECAWSVDGGMLLLAAGTVDPGTWTGLAGDGNLSNPRNWYGGEVPTDAATIKCGTPQTLTVGAVFAPSSIVFPAGCAALAIEGNISGLSSIVNNSTANMTFAGFVDFGEGNIDVTQNATYNDTSHVVSGGCVVFAGGARGVDVANHSIFTGSYTLTKTDKFDFKTESNSRYVLNTNATLNVKATDQIHQLYIKSGATFHVETASHGWKSTSTGTQRRLWGWNEGTFIADSYSLTGNGQMWLGGYVGNSASANLNKNGVLKVGTVTIDETSTGNYSGRIWLHGYGSSGEALTTYIGAGGLNFNSKSKGYFGVENNKHASTIRPWNSDFTIGRGANENYDFMLKGAAIDFSIHTTDEDGVARTVTLNGRFTTEEYTDTTITVKGTGTNVVNSASPLMVGTYAVADTATVVLNNGAGFANGTVSVGATATLAVGESGTASVGNLTLAAGAKLGFIFTDRQTVPVLALSEGGNVAFTGEDEPNISVKISGDVRPVGGLKVLTTGGGFGGTAVTLAAGAPEWAQGRLSVNADGNIVLDVKPMGTMVIVR